MPVGYGLQQYAKPPDLEQDLMGSVDEFAEYLRAGRTRSAQGQGTDAFMQQAGQEAAQPFQPKTPDYILGAAAVALPIIAALLPEGKRGRGRRKSQRMRNVLGTLGGFAGQGLLGRIESFGAGKETTYKAAEARAGRLGEESQAEYERKIGGIELKRDIGQEKWERGMDVAKLGLETQREKRLGLPQDPYTASQRYQMGRTGEKDRQTRVLQDADAYLKSLPFAGDIEGSIKSVEDLNTVVSVMRSQAQISMRMAPEAQTALANLERFLNEYYGETTEATPQEQTDFERLKAKYGTQ